MSKQLQVEKKARNDGSIIFTFDCTSVILL